jgi:hypothetical protein
VTDALAVASTLIAAGGLFFSGWQLRLIHKERKKDRALGIEGSACHGGPSRRRTRRTWTAKAKVTWTYAFKVDNPGRFPISDIAARVTFPTAVARIRHNDVLDKPDPVLTLAHPVLPGGGSHEWAHRRLSMFYDGTQKSAKISR